MSVPHVPERVLLMANGVTFSDSVDKPLQSRTCGWSLHFTLIDTRTLLGEVLLDALQAVDPAAEGNLLPDVASWLQQTPTDDAHVVLLSLDPQPGRTPEDCMLDLKLLRKAAPMNPVIVVSSEENPEFICSALDLGVGGYVCTNLNVHAMMQVIRLVQAGDRYVPAASFQKMMRRPAGNVKERVEQDSLLSHREMLVAKALRRGTPNKVIAYELNMCESTVKVHVRHIMKKLKAKNRTQVAFLTNEMFAEQPAHIL